MIRVWIEHGRSILATLNLIRATENSRQTWAYIANGLEKIHKKLIQRRRSIISALPQYWIRKVGRAKRGLQLQGFRSGEKEGKKNRGRTRINCSYRPRTGGTIEYAIKKFSN